MLGAQHGVGSEASYSGYFFSSCVELKAMGGGELQCFFNRLRHHRDYDDPCPGRFGIAGTNVEVGQGLDPLFLASLEASMSVMEC